MGPQSSDSRNGTQRAAQLFAGILALIAVLAGTWSTQQEYPVRESGRDELIFLDLADDAPRRISPVAASPAPAVER